MIRRTFGVVFILTLLLAGTCATTPTYAQQHHGDTYSSATRDANGKIHRSPQAKEQFRKLHPCPSTGKTHGACPGYVVDHVVALKRGGADAPSNMQWQTTTAAKAKDKIE